jgi:hypothetical protein
MIEKWTESGRRIVEETWRRLGDDDGRQKDRESKRT